MRLVVSASRRGPLSRLGSSFRWRKEQQQGTLPSLIDTMSSAQRSCDGADRHPSVDMTEGRHEDDEDDDDGYAGVCSLHREYASSTTVSLVDQCSEELENETPNSFISLEPPVFDDEYDDSDEHNNNDDCNHNDSDDCCQDTDTVKTDDETASTPSEDENGGDEDEVPPSASVMVDTEEASIHSTTDSSTTTADTSPRRVTFARTYQEIRFRKHENTRAIWYSREDRKHTITQCAQEIAQCVQSDPLVAFRTLVDQCNRLHPSNATSTDFHDVMHVRGLLRPCLTRLGHADKVIRDWVYTPKRSVHAVLRVQEQGAGEAALADIYVSFTTAAARWAHYLAVADAMAVDAVRRSPYEQVHV